MKQVISTEKKPIKMWLDDIELGALRQAMNLANLPFVFNHISIMPDSHIGYGMPIGCVLATQGAIVPNAVGVDIGCGMAFIETGYTDMVSADTLKAIMGDVRKAVPLGFAHHETDQENPVFWTAPDVEVIQSNLDASRRQIGTLGGGNHFIEFQINTAERLCVMIHSGSRNFGLRVANHYHEKAVELCGKWHSQLPDKDLAFLPDDSIHGINYFSAMQYCVEWARYNRLAIMGKIEEILLDHLGPLAAKIDYIDTGHNYARREIHFDREVIIHRKGAIRAIEGERVVIPGSMGTNSFIVEGCGNADSFRSASHGAGRKMGRMAAKLMLNLEEEQGKMNGIVHGIRERKNLDEAPGAYKNIHEVMNNQRDLVSIIDTLRPLGSIKG